VFTPRLAADSGLWGVPQRLGANSCPQLRRQAAGLNTTTKSTRPFSERALASAALSISHFLTRSHLCKPPSFHHTHTPQTSPFPPLLRSRTRDTDETTRLRTSFRETDGQPSGFSVFPAAAAQALFGQGHHRKCFSRPSSPDEGDPDAVTEPREAPRPATQSFERVKTFPSKAQGPRVRKFKQRAAAVAQEEADQAAAAHSHEPHGDADGQNYGRVSLPCLFTIPIPFDESWLKIRPSFTNKVTSSPVRARPRVDTTPTKRMAQSQPGSSNHPTMNYAFSSSEEEDTESRVASTTFSELMPRPQADIFAPRADPNLAARRQMQPPSPIQVSTRRVAGAVAFNPEQAMPVSPLTPPGLEHHGYVPTRPESEQASGFYPACQQAMSTDRRGTYATASSDGNANGPVIDMYNAWAAMRSTGDSFQPPPRVESLAHRPRRSKSTSEGLRSDCLHRPSTLSPPTPPPALPARIPAAQVVVAARDETLEDQVFSPLALYFCGRDFPTVKKGEKTMIGQNGWLERTERSSPEKEKKTPQKKAGILESIKKIAKDMVSQREEQDRGEVKDMANLIVTLQTAEFNSSRKAQAQVKDAGPPSQIAISLSPREQSLLYCELEYHLTGAIHDYITDELERGHLVADNLKKIADFWVSQGRPKVVGFRYDLETQLELVNLHINDFNFYGRRQSNPVEIAGLLHCMKVNARQMRVRTFCQPDSVVAKQLVDSQSLFNMINVSRARQVGLAEIAQFFKAIVEREREYREKRSREVRKTRVEQPGQSFASSAWPQQQYDRPRHSHQKKSSREHDNRAGDRTSYGAREVQGYDMGFEDPLPYAR